MYHSKDFLVYGFGVSGPDSDFSVLGARTRRGVKGLTRPLVGPGQNPGLVPLTENDFKCFRMDWKALLCTILYNTILDFKILKIVMKIK